LRNILDERVKTVQEGLHEEARRWFQQLEQRFKEHPEGKRNILQNCSKKHL